ncbi:unnamed protein product [Spirodela intermedia]|uniref:DNA-directed RNA polymerase subunit n=1 Tax=Spirodela intermedia TaxID=51605 RepID=A0A7I8JSP6_SPIIN|nr:unnamed protein product [Spirodela intermedia]CAA6673144.1 unnamed protein product [Spirodela intermedia]
MESPMAEALRVSDADLLVYVTLPTPTGFRKHCVVSSVSPSSREFNETFDGVLLAYSFGLPSKTARILPGLIPYLCVNVKAKLLLFSPRQDMLLEGKVVKLNKETIYVVVLGFCAAAITSENIREEFRYKIKGGHGMFSSTAHKRHVIKPGTILRFLVKRHGLLNECDATALRSKSRRTT